MINEAKYAVFKAIQTDKKIFEYINGRVYPAELATLADVDFPCVNFRIDGGSQYNGISKIVRLRMRLWIWSKKNWSECYNIYNEVNRVINDEIFRTAEGIRLIPRLEVTPVEAFDATYGTFSLESRWILRVIG